MQKAGFLTTRLNSSSSFHIQLGHKGLSSWHIPLGHKGLSLVFENKNLKNDNALSQTERQIRHTLDFLTLLMIVSLFVTGLFQMFWCFQNRFSNYAVIASKMIRYVLDTCPGHRIALFDIKDLLLQKLTN